MIQQQIRQQIKLEPGLYYFSKRKENDPSADTLGKYVEKIAGAQEADEKRCMALSGIRWKSGKYRRKKQGGSSRKKTGII